jgi:subtilisin family serine protease
MRNLAHLLLGLWLAAMSGAALAQAPAPRIIVAFTNQPHGSPGPAGTTGSHYAGGGYSVAQVAQGEAHRVARTYALHPLASWPIQALALHCVVYEITDGRDVAQVLATLSKDARIVLAQPMQEFRTLTTAAAAAGAAYNDPLYDLQTNLTTLGIARAQARTQGRGLKVALIDTAVDTDHPDLRGRIVRSHSYLPEGTATGSSLRHGTAMAGIIVAVANNHVGIVGIAPQAQVEVFAACWQLAPDADAAACNTFTLAQALAAAIASGAPVINLSIAGPPDPLLGALVQHGLARGVTFVGAYAGSTPGFPTAIAGVIAAGDSGSALPAGVLAAPAEHVMTLRPQGQYDFASGTSVSAAEITGVIALLMSASASRLSPAQVVALLNGTGAEQAAARAPAAVDVNAALARLDSAQHRGITTAGTAL